VEAIPRDGVVYLVKPIVMDLFTSKCALKKDKPSGQVFPSSEAAKQIRPPPIPQVLKSKIEGRCMLGEGVSELELLEIG